MDYDTIIKKVLTDDDFIDNIITDIANKINAIDDDETYIVKKAIEKAKYVDKYLNEYEKRLKESFDIDEKIDELEKLGDDEAIYQAIDEYILNKQMREFNQYESKFNTAIDTQIKDLKNSQLIDENEAIDKYVNVIEQERLRDNKFVIDDDEDILVSQLIDDNRFAKRINERIIILYNL